MADWQALWDDTEMLYDKFREAKDDQVAADVHDRRINRCLDLLNDVERDLEKAGAFPHSVHPEQQGEEDPDGPVFCNACKQPVKWTRRNGWKHQDEGVAFARGIHVPVPTREPIEA
jgi:hypothetical protein